MTGVVISAPPAAAAISAPDPGVVEAAAADDPADVCPEGVALPDDAAAAPPLMGDTGPSFVSSASVFFFFFLFRLGTVPGVSEVIPARALSSFGHLCSSKTSKCLSVSRTAAGNRIIASILARLWSK